MLIEKPALDVGSGNSSSHGLATPNEQEDSNPLRMLRSGGLTVVRPKIRGNKHQSVRESRELKVNCRICIYFGYLLFYGSVGNEFGRKHFHLLFTNRPRKIGSSPGVAQDTRHQPS